jgi:NmrA-like family
VDVVISTISTTALDVQEKIAVAAKEAGVQLFIPSEYGSISEGETEGVFGAKAKMQGQLKALGIPYAAFYTGSFSDFAWVPCVPFRFFSGFLASPFSPANG